jgi:hypothetical protein
MLLVQMKTLGPQLAVRRLAVPILKTGSFQHDAGL